MPLGALRQSAGAHHARFAHGSTSAPRVRCGRADKLPHAHSVVSRTQGPVFQRAQLSEPKDPRVPSVAISTGLKVGEATPSSGERTRGLGTASSVSSAGLQLVLEAV